MGKSVDLEITDGKTVENPVEPRWPDGRYSSKEWTYIVNSERASVGGGTRGLTAVPYTQEGAVVIPSEFYGCPVVGIGAYAFCNCSKITSISIPSHIESVGEGAFEGCAKLKTFILDYDDAERILCLIEASGFDLHDVEVVRRRQEDGVHHMSIDGIDWTYEIKDGFAYVGSGLVGSITAVEGFPESIVVPCEFGGCMVKGVSANAFYGLKSLKFVSIPQTVTNIGVGAFMGCSGLTNLELPSDLVGVGSSMCYGCYGLKELTIPSGVSQVGKSAFADCYWLTVLRISRGVHEIESCAFYNCYGLYSVEIPASIISIGALAFDKCSNLRYVYVEPGDAERVKNLMETSGCDTSLVSFKEVRGAAIAPHEDPAPVLEKKAKVIDDVYWTYVVSNKSVIVGGGSFAYTAVPYFFEGNVTIPQNIDDMPVVSLNVGSFSLLPGLTSVVIPEGVLEVQKTAFESSIKLNRVIMPRSLKRVGKSAFEMCYSIEEMNIPEGVEEIGERVFYNCTNLHAVTLPTTLKRVSYDAFGNCARLQNVTMRMGLEDIDDYAFYSCSKITSVTIPNGVTNIGSLAFYHCDNLETLTLPSSLVKIGDLAFRYCDKLSLVRVIADSDEELTRIKTELMSHTGSGLGDIEWVRVRQPSKPKIGIQDGTIVSGPVKVSLTTPDDSVAMHYTLDGSMPTDQSPLYTSAFTIVGATMIRAVAIRDGVMSEIAEAKVWNGKCDRPKIGCGMDFSFNSSEFAVPIKAPDDCKILYTIDGTDPTIKSAVYTEPICVSVTTVIKAMAVGQDGYANSEVACVCAKREYAAVCDPACSMSDGAVFRHSEHRVSLSCETQGAVIYYTTDGSLPTLKSDVYGGGLVLSESTTLNFVAAKEDFLPSSICTVRLLREWEKVITPLIHGEGTFVGGSTVLRLSCETPGAKMLYTIDGSDPITNGTLYDGEIRLSDSAVVKAVAIKDDCLDSDVAELAVVRNWTVGEVLEIPEQIFISSGDADWVIDWSCAYEGGSSMRSGCVGDNESSVLATDIGGDGLLSFYWRSSCEETKTPQLLLYDHGEVCVDGETCSYRQGSNKWVRCEIRLGAGKHHIEWKYVKDGSDSFYEDCVWIDKLEWCPSRIIQSVEDLAVYFSTSSDVIENIVDDVLFERFNGFLAACGVTTISDMTESQKQYAYRSFKLSEITTAPQLFDAEPVLKFDDLELTGGNLSLTISLSAGAEAIQLAKDKLAEKIRVGSTLGGITSKPTIVMSPGDDGTSLTFIIAPPKGDQGFVKVQID